VLGTDVIEIITRVVDFIVTMVVSLVGTEDFGIITGDVI
jgi:hypothetical protein